MDQEGEYKAYGVSLKSSSQRLKTEERSFIIMRNS
jgi:hypothetical protein